jgi:hypothetical protein
LASLGTARTKAKDSSAKISMSSIATQGGEYFSANNTYVGLFNDPQIIKLVTSVNSNTGHTVASGTSATAFQANVTLNDGSTFCVDSDGFSGSTTAPAANATACQ